MHLIKLPVSAAVVVVVVRSIVQIKAINGNQYWSSKLNDHPLNYAVADSLSVLLLLFYVFVGYSKWNIFDFYRSKFWDYLKCYEFFQWDGILGIVT